MPDFRSIQIDLARYWQGRGDAKVMKKTRSHYQAAKPSSAKV
jgi:hypothetical protein